MTKYDDLIEEFKEATAQAGEIIPKMYDALKEEGLSQEDARDRIEKDLLPFYSKRWIRACLPEEAVHKEKANKPKDAEVTSASAGVVTELSNSDGTVLLNKQGPDDENPTTANQPKPESPPDTTAPTTSFLREVTKGIEEKLSQKADFTAEVLQGVIEKLSSIDMEVFSVGEQVEIIDGSKCPKCWFKLHARVRKGRKLELFKAM